MIETTDKPRRFYKKKKYQKPSDQFWKTSFMKVLSCLEYESLSWEKGAWPNYGLSNADIKKIEQEYRFWKSKLEKQNLENINNGQS